MGTKNPRTASFRIRKPAWKGLSPAVAIAPSVDPCGDVPVFGPGDDAAEYVVRPSAYAIIANDSGEIAIVTTRTGCYLPGGGLERDETPESAVARECREECGFAIRNLRYLGSAVQKLFAPGEGWFRLEGAFYVADGDRPRLQPN